MTAVQKKNQYFRLSGEGIKFWRSIADKIYFVTCFFFADKSTLYKFSSFFFSLFLLSYRLET